MSSSNEDGASPSAQRGNAASRRESVSGSERSRDERLDSRLPSDTGNADDLFGSDGSDDEAEYVCGF